MDDKYITFKRDDWDDLMQPHRSDYGKKSLIESLESVALKDSVVIRLKDEFASAALHTYANSISVAARAIGMHAPETSKRLQSIADYFHGRATASDDLSEHKLPD